MMDPLLTNGIDPALLRVLEKRGDEREAVPRRKRPAASEKADEEENGEEGNENNDEGDPTPPKHALDDLA